MIFFLGILTAVAFAWAAIKMGLYEMWVLFINALISAYLGIFLGPRIAESILSGPSEYSNALGVGVCGIGFFLILQGATYLLITSQFSVSLPKPLEIFGGGFVGFLAGLFVWGFLNIFILLMPFSQGGFVKGMGVEIDQANISYTAGWCNMLNSIVSTDDKQIGAKEMLSQLVADVEASRKGKGREVEETGGEEQSEPNEIEAPPTVEELIGAPPEADIDDI